MLVLKDKHFLFIALISLMTGILMDSANGYVSIHMVNHLGGPANSASLFTVATALPEILLLGIIGKWFTKFGYKKVYLLSAAILTVRYIIYVFSPNITVFIAASVVHCIAVGVSTVGNLGYLKAVIPEHSYGTAVTLYTASMSIGRAVYSLVFGYILDWAGSTAIYGIAAIIMTGATFLIYKTNLFSEAESKIVSE